MFFSWFWVWLGAATLIALVIPMAFWRRCRFGYASLLSVASIALVGTTWLRNLNAREGVLLRYSINAASFIEENNTFILSSDGGLGLISIEYRQCDPEQVRRQDGKTRCSWFRDRSRAYPGAANPAFKGCGFQITWYGEPDRPGGLSTRHLWAFVFPAWFPIPFLLIMPALYVRRAVKRQKARRWLAAGCCGKCGYDLRATPGGGKCQECGTPVPEGHKPTVAAGGTDTATRRTGDAAKDEPAKSPTA